MLNQLPAHRTRIDPRTWHLVMVHAFSGSTDCLLRHLDRKVSRTGISRMPKSRISRPSHGRMRSSRASSSRSSIKNEPSSARSRTSPRPARDGRRASCTRTYDGPRLLTNRGLLPHPRATPDCFRPLTAAPPNPQDYFRAPLSPGPSSRIPSEHRFRRVEGVPVGRRTRSAQLRRGSSWGSETVGSTSNPVEHAR